MLALAKNTMSSTQEGFTAELALAKGHAAGDAHANALDVLAHEPASASMANELQRSAMMMDGTMQMVAHADLPETRPQDILNDGRDGAKQGREDIELLTRKLQGPEANERRHAGEDDYVFPDPVPVPQELPRTPEKVGPSLRDRFKGAGRRQALIGNIGIKRSPRPLHEAAAMGDVFDMNELMVDPEEEARKRREALLEEEDEEDDNGEEGFSRKSIFAKDSPLNGKHDPSEQNSNGQTPMHFAACHGHEEAISALLHRGADINVQDKQGQTPLHFAAAYGREAIVQALLRLPRTDPTIRDNSLQTPLHVAVRLQQLPLYRLLREHPSGDAAARMRDVEGRLPASLAPNRKGRALALECDDVVASIKNIARRGGSQALKDLLSRDDAQFVMGWHDEVGRQLIHYAACHGRPELCSLLLDPQYTSASAEEVAAIASSVDKRGFTPLHYASSWGHVESMAVLLEATDMMKKPAYEKSVKFRAMADCPEGLSTLETIKWKRDNGIDQYVSTAAHARMVNSRDTAGRTALHCAAMEGREEAVSLLLLRGGDISSEDHAGQTPQDVACNGKILKVTTEKMAGQSSSLGLF